MGKRSGPSVTAKVRQTRKEAYGSLWSVGLNSAGQLGDGTAVNKSVFTRVGALNTWKSVNSGRNHLQAIHT